MVLVSPAVRQFFSVVAQCTQILPLRWPLLSGYAAAIVRCWHVATKRLLIIVNFRIDRRPGYCKCAISAVGSRRPQHLKMLQVNNWCHCGAAMSMQRG